ncbi:MAG: hypothetical protein ABJL55_00585 [Roseibium sp.]
MFDWFGETKLSSFGLLLLITAAAMTMFVDFDTKNTPIIESGSGYHGYLN